MKRVVGLLAGVLVLASCSQGKEVSDQRQGQTGFVSGNGNVSTFAPAERKQAPEFGGETLDGTQWKSADQRGKVVVVNVWGSWCPPCRKEAPDLVAAATELGPGVQFIGINNRDQDKAPAKAFVDAFGVTFPSLYDPSGKLLLKFRGQKVSPATIPSTLVIDTNGRVAARVLGPVTKQTLVGMVKDAG